MLKSVLILLAVYGAQPCLKTPELILPSPPTTRPITTTSTSMTTSSTSSTTTSSTSSTTTSSTPSTTTTPSTSTSTTTMTTTTTSCTLVCPAGYDTILLDCYMYIGDSYTWDSASAQCAALGAYLPIITTVAQNDAVTSVYGGSFPIGVRRKAGTISTYLYENGTVVTDFLWRLGEPDGFNDCVMASALIVYTVSLKSLGNLHKIIFVCFFMSFFLFLNDIFTMFGYSGAISNGLSSVLCRAAEGESRQPRCQWSFEIRSSQRLQDCLLDGYSSKIMIRSTSQQYCRNGSSEKVKILPWPSQSPDLNPTEHLWQELKKRTAGISARNSDEKFAILQHGWYIDQHTIDRLMASAPNCCREVERARGFSTKY